MELSWSETRVLVVEDEPAVAEVLTTILRRRGCHVDVAGGLAAGRTALEGGRYQVLIVDKNLPDGNGIDFVVEALRLDPGALPLLFTGYPSRQSYQDAIAAGCWGYVFKPLEHATRIFDEIQAAWARRAAGEPPQLLGR